MAKLTVKSSTGWSIPKEVKEAFVNFCAQTGTLVQDDCAGALFIWQRLPAQIREWAKLAAKDAPGVDDHFWKDFAAGLQLGLQAQSNTPPKKPAKNG